MPESKPLAGLLAKYPNARFWTYIIYALLLLILSALLSMVSYQLIGEDVQDEFVRWVSWLQHVLNLAGVAFGLTAATNVDRQFAPIEFTPPTTTYTPDVTG